VNTPPAPTSGEYPASANLAGKRFVLSGFSRLAVRVADLLAAGGATVSLVGDDEAQLAGRLHPNVRLIPANGDHASALAAAGLQGSECVLLLADDDLENLRAALACRSMAASTPVVLRAFDATLSDQLERGLDVRRAYSVSSISAASFVAAALGADVVETMRLGDVQIPIAVLEIREGSTLAGMSPSQVERRYACALMGAEAERGWQTDPGDIPVLTGRGRIAVGGRLHDVLRLARENGSLPRPGRRQAFGRQLRGLLARTGRRNRPPRGTLKGSTLLPVAGIAFGVLLLATMVIFSVALHLSPAEALYQAVLTAFGSPSLADSAPWLKIFAVTAVIVGGALVGVLFGYVAAYVTTERLERRMGRRAHRLHDHIVLAGLGSVGYRVEKLLFELGVPAVMVDRSPDPRYLSAVGERTPVVSGDVRLPENLQRAGIATAACIVACTDDDLANVEACIQARSLNPAIRTVARIFDTEMAERMTDAFGVDAAISTTRVAARAFVGAAIDERALRPFDLGRTPHLAMRFEPGLEIPPSEIDAWRAAGVRVLAVRRDGDPAVSSDASGGLSPGDHTVLAGPAEAVRSLVLPSASFRGTR
jgi:Trk K+ transport system NAD-binding subunit